MRFQLGMESIQLTPVKILLLFSNCELLAFLTFWLLYLSFLHTPSLVCQLVTWLRHNILTVQISIPEANCDKHAIRFNGFLDLIFLIFWYSHFNIRVMCHFLKLKIYLFKSLSVEIASTISPLVSLARFHSDLLAKLRCYESCLKLLEDKEDYENFR